MSKPQRAGGTPPALCDSAAGWSPDCLPPDATLVGVGAAGSLVGERVFVAGQVVCSNHHQKPNMGKPYQSQGSWCADVDACCDDLMGRVERELGANQ